MTQNKLLRPFEDVAKYPVIFKTFHLRYRRRLLRSSQVWNVYVHRGMDLCCWHPVLPGEWQIGKWIWRGLSREWVVWKIISFSWFCISNCQLCPRPKDSLYVSLMKGSTQILMIKPSLFNLLLLWMYALLPCKGCTAQLHVNRYVCI